MLLIFEVMEYSVYLEMNMFKYDCRFYINNPVNNNLLSIFLIHI